MSRRIKERLSHIESLNRDGFKFNNLALKHSKIKNELENPQGHLEHPYSYKSLQKK